jgi:hypothetical protein
MKLTNAMIWTAAAAVVLLGSACADQHKPQTNAQFFKNEGAGDQLNRFRDVQAANGARNDGMLYAHHFNDGRLNSLGRQKILLMLADCDSCDPMTVHLVNCGQGDLLTQRKAAVELYLKTTEGVNVATLHSAQNDIVRYMKTESGSSNPAENTVDTSAMGTSPTSATPK